MIILEIFLNNELLYQIGGDDLTKMSVMLDLSGKLGVQSKSDEDIKAWIEGYGSTKTHKDAGEVRKWGQQSLEFEDEITIKITNGNNPSKYIDSQKIGSQDEDFERWKFEDAKKTYYKLKSKFEPE